MMSQGCSSSLKGPGNQGRTGRKQVTFLSPRRRIWGSTSQSVSPSSVGGLMEQNLETVSKGIKNKMVIVSSHHGFMIGKSCLNNLIAFFLQ